MISVLKMALKPRTIGLTGVLSTEGGMCLVTPVQVRLAWAPDAELWAPSPVVMNEQCSTSKERNRTFLTSVRSHTREC